MNKKIYLGAIASAIINDKLWFSNHWFNGLFFYDLKTNEIHYKDCFPNMPVDAEEFHASAYDITGKLIFTPLTGDKIHVYDLTSGLIDAVDLPNKYKYYTKAIKIENKVFFATDDFTILYYDIYEGRCEKDKKLTKLITEYDKKYVCSLIREWNQGFDLVSEENKKCIHINIIDGSIQIIDLPSSAVNIYYSYWNKNNVYISSNDSMDILCIDTERSERKKYLAKDLGWRKGIKCAPYSLLFSTDIGVVLTNYYCDHIAVIDEESNVVKSLLDLPDDSFVTDYLVSAQQDAI